NGNADIYGYNLTTKEEFQITTDRGNQYSPAIYEDVVVWTDERRGNSDIFGYNFNSRYNSTTKTPKPPNFYPHGEFQITTDASTQQYPAIYGHIVVWTDYRNNNADIYAYDFSSLYYERWCSSNHEDNRSLVFFIFFTDILVAFILSIYFFHDYAAKKRRVSLPWGFGFLFYSILSMPYMLNEIFYIDIDGITGYYYFLIYMPIIFGVLIAFEMTSFYYGASLLFFSKESFFRGKISIFFMVFYFIFSFYLIKTIVSRDFFSIWEPLMWSHWVLKIPIFLMITILFYHTYLETDSNASLKDIFLYISISFLIMTINSILMPLSFFYIIGDYFAATIIFEPIVWILMGYCLIIRKAAVRIWKRRIIKDTMLAWKEIRE
ncbi:MAG: hypothetical protein PVF58_20185, partial [Candidatus Methanofastidiosia archaeon]